MQSKIVVPGQYITPTYNLVQDKKQSQQSESVKYLAGTGTVVNPIEVDGRVLPVICATIVGKTQFIKANKDEQQDGEENQASDKERSGSELTYLVNVVPTSTNENSEGSLSNPTSSVSNTTSINLPQENDIVLVRITRISQKQANCEIIALESRSKPDGTQLGQNTESSGSGNANANANGGNILADSGAGSNGATAQASLPHGGGSQHNHNLQTVASSASTTHQATIYDLGENYRGIIRASDIRSTERDKCVVGQCFKPGDVVRCMIISLGDGQNYYCSTARNDLGVVLAKSVGGAGGLMYPVDWQNMIDLDTGVVEKRKNANPFIV
ncbi:CSL4 [Candida theae]|uniref:CSL4 n=1 Tax=Candida theae TaxID=1198502 RepID=A0AAD5FZJ6_9ASCO|nr:CSL4 [Candida theae]KAI5961537.1 CSL4 [Candida theae]